MSFDTADRIGDFIVHIIMLLGLYWYFAVFTLGTINSILFVLLFPCAFFDFLFILLIIFKIIQDIMNNIL